MHGIQNFDSVTYRVGNHDSLNFWNSVGATVSGLIHIEGNIPDMIETLNKAQPLKNRHKASVKIKKNNCIFLPRFI